ncbi:MAG: DUF1343 domain-containing protein, partial [Planctomycetes bacterium]|nr:DUF1343 domain-containing protein [Planctomycetota bacterium]
MRRANLKGIGILLAVGLAATCSASVRTGLDDVAAHRELFQGRRVGIIANHTSCNREGKHIVDVF